MKNPKLLRHIALYGISLPTFAVSPAVAKATVYMPSHIAARMLGGRAPRTTDIANDQANTAESSAGHPSRQHDHHPCPPRGEGRRASG
jgi:hypothetical protein